MLQQKKVFSLEKETQQKKVLKVKRNVRINFPFFKQTSHYSVYGSEGNATTVGYFPMVDLVYDAYQFYRFYDC